jgi:Ring finger domain
MSCSIGTILSNFHAWIDAMVVGPFAYLVISKQYETQFQLEMKAFLPSITNTISFIDNVPILLFVPEPSMNSLMREINDTYHKNQTISPYLLDETSRDWNLIYSVRTTTQTKYDLVLSPTYLPYYEGNYPMSVPNVNTYYNPYPTYTTGSYYYPYPTYNPPYDYNTYYNQPSYSYNYTEEDESESNIGMIMGVLAGFFGIVIMIAFYNNHEKFHIATGQPHATSSSTPPPPVPNYERFAPAVYVSHPTNRPVVARSVPQPQPIRSSVQNNSNNNKDKNQNDCVTYQEFSDLPRIHYSEYYTYSMRKIHNCVIGKNENENENSYFNHRDGVDNEPPLNNALEIQSEGTSNNNGMDNPNSSNAAVRGDHTTAGIDRNEACAICVEDFQNDELVIMLPQCQHLYHIKCLGLWLLDQKSTICPICKVPVVKKKDDKKKESDRANHSTTTTITTTTLNPTESDHIIIYPVVDTLSSSPFQDNNDRIMVDSMVTSDHPTTDNVTISVMDSSNTPTTETYQRKTHDVLHL